MQVKCITFTVSFTHQTEHMTQYCWIAISRKWSNYQILQYFHWEEQNLLESAGFYTIYRFAQLLSVKNGWRNFTWFVCLEFHELLCLELFVIRRRRESDKCDMSCSIHTTTVWKEKKLKLNDNGSSSLGGRQQVATIWRTFILTWCYFHFSLMLILYFVRLIAHNEILRLNPW